MTATGKLCIMDTETAHQLFHHTRIISIHSLNMDPLIPIECNDILDLL